MIRVLPVPARAGQRHEVAFRVQQQVQASSARGCGRSRPGRVLAVGVVLEGAQHGALARDLGDLAVPGCHARAFQVHDWLTISVGTAGPVMR